MTDHDAPILFDCPRCHAVPGQRCTGTARAVQYSHQPRQDRYIRHRKPCAQLQQCAAQGCPFLTRSNDRLCPLHVGVIPS